MIKKIIEELSDNNQSLVNPLLKTKVLASRLGNEILLSWVNNELNGYNDIDDKEVPSYRIAKANSLCNIHQGYHIEYNTPIPITLLPHELRKMFSGFPLLEAVHTLESYQRNQKSDTLVKPFPVDFWAYITSEVRKNGTNFNITNISITTHISSITQALAEIRTKFLDLMLALEHEFPDLTNIAEESQVQKEQISKQITYIMKQINIKNSGDGSTINTGNSNQINSASGNNIDQDILVPEQRKEIEKLMTQIRAALDENEIDNKDDTILEVQRVENQLKKENPKKSIISQSIETIKSFLTSVAANAWTQPILIGIQNVLGSIA